ncbi:MAG: DUF4339 domain-containing protein [Lutibacter sp.]|uniref:DUF4339 domain-containing protein n=1 Tax=Lutibacter sp. TaxID=1925666 RepID=UPI00299D5C66|nr:DUF4339 domain-containing protein [Lutibacter sp.]MDX1828891.1 DUF4339 domain-containing protein [Lutibacter sp.]
MTDKIYFYLDGADKKGPLSKDEIIALKLSEKTLIYYDGLDNWQPISELEDFKEKNTVNDLKFEEQETKTEKRKIKIPSFIIFLFIATIASTIAYYISERIKEKDLQLIKQNVNDIFNGKDEICDFTKTGVKGDLKLNPGKHTLDWLSYFYKNDNEDKELYEMFICESGGWTVLTLTKLNNGYKYVESYSTDMGFKVPESTYTPGTNYGYGVKTSGYSLPTYRGTVQNAYNEAMNYISVEKENKSYLAGVYNKIMTFGELNSEFHSVNNVEPSKYSSESVFAKSWESMGEASVFNKKWIVWYKSKGKHYEIVLNEEKYKKRLIINLSIALGITLLIFLIWKISKRFEIKI